MKNKILCLIVVMLFLAIIPSISTASEIQSEGDWLFLKGTIKINEIENNTVHAFAFRLAYFEYTEIERSWGWISLHKVIFPDGFHMIPIGNIYFIFGIVRGQGGLEIPD